MTEAPEEKVNEVRQYVTGLDALQKGQSDALGDVYISVATPECWRCQGCEMSPKES
ncbi:rCG57014 [Rattus norvegicus]|uniref:RCG57014 n=1 Tax=Rattus norvegicus TaxID=10116 RepID=A6JD01_RAT|nr:rCG57014 [Rattus norvegicus]